MRFYTNGEFCVHRTQPHQKKYTISIEIGLVEKKVVREEAHFPVSTVHSK